MGSQNDPPAPLLSASVLIFGLWRLSCEALRPPRPSKSKSRMIRLLNFHPFWSSSGRFSAPGVPPGNNWTFVFESKWLLRSHFGASWASCETPSPPRPLSKGCGGNLKVGPFDLKVEIGSLFGAFGCAWTRFWSLFGHLCAVFACLFDFSFASVRGNGPCTQML